MLVCLIDFSSPKMSELHLELCRQSTKHLKDTISSIKENLRILEVFIDSGLTDDARCSIGNNLLSGVQTNLENLDGGNSKTSDSKTRNKKENIQKTENHKNCCCMCPSRTRRNSSSYHGSRISSSSTLLQSRRSPSKRPVSMPRLNRTASLRRDTAVERAQMQMSSTQRPL